MRGIASRIAWGIRQGLFFGLGFFLIAIVVAILTSGNALEANGRVSLGTLFVTYVLAGVTSGALVGVIRDIRKGPVLKILVAVLAAVPVSLAVALAAEGGSIGRVSPAATVTLVVIFGVGGAWVFWDDY